MRLQRIVRMGVPELACRARQEAFKRLDRLALGRGAIAGPEAVLAKLDLRGPGARSPAGAAHVLRDRFWARAPDRFFEGAASEDVRPFFDQHLPAARDRLLATAESVCAGSFDLLGYRGLRFGDPPDWHLDPVSGRRSPLVHWSRLDPLGAAAIGDYKVIWELNRHQWLVHLGMAHRLTGDERFARVFADSVRGWLQANPPGTGINWASSLEVALRLISWCWSLVLFRRSEALSADLFMTMLSGIEVHASHVERYLSYYFSPNTHLTGEALGLFYAGTLFPEFRAAERWRTLAARVLLDQVERQVLPDGVYYEQSTCYQRYTVEIYLHFALLARRNNVTVPASVEDRVERMLDFLVAIRRPDGSIPQIGDADGGWLLPLGAREPHDLRGIFSAAAVHFGRADYAWAAGALAPEALWLLGPASCQGSAPPHPAQPLMPLARSFETGGYVVMRSGPGEAAHHLILDTGPLGGPESAGHGHADLLSVQCSVFGEPYIVDPGTYCYTADARWRDYFRSTQAHSTVVVDDRSQAIPIGPFAWKTRPRARLRRWASTETHDVAEGEHQAYRDLADPVAHRRRVTLVDHRYWLIVDDLRGSAEHQVEVRFQFAPMQVSVGPDLWARASRGRGAGLFLRAFAPVSLHGKVLEGELDPIAGWVSTNYGQRTPAPVLIYSAVARLPLRIVTLLLPTENILGTPPVVHARGDEPGGPVALMFASEGEIIHLDDPASDAERG